ncbi:Predicted ATPase [Actinacidiphila yanglinensis]|uniref:Predicted ATPase n=1 Tax=Actinacidiphila yanglinensis TaxID=310779 RepID=A0A1H6DGB8_9ACTN|nr:Predicted ATPase [Actinacidiphila yanglinensis]
MAPVGRARELRLFETVARASEHGPQFVALVGDPGIGKTHLLTAVRRRFAGAGWQVVSGRARAVAVPYGLLADALDGLPEGAAAGLAPQDAESVAVVLPVLGRGAAPAGPPTEGYPVGRAISSLLQCAAAASPLLILLDDVHQADAASLEILEYLLHHPPHRRVVIAAAYRPRQGPDLPWQGYGSHGALPVWLVAPRPLGAQEVDSLIPPGTAPARQAVLREASAGNPGVLRAFLQAGSTASGRGYGMDELRIGVPPVVPGALAVGQNRLTPLARLVAEAAAVAGDPFEPDVVAAVAHLAEPRVLAGLDELLAADLLRSEGVWRGFRFRDLAVRAGFYHASGAGWRCAAHSRAATALYGRGMSATRCAHHLEHAAAIGDTAAAAQLLTAAREAVPLAPDQAVRWLRTADRLLAHRTPPELPALLAIALAASGRVGPCLQAHEAAGADPRLDAGLRGEATQWCARALRFGGDHSAARRLLLSARPAGRAGAGLHLERVTLAYELGTSHAQDQAELLRLGTDGERPVRAHAQALLALLALDRDDRTDAAAYALDAAVLVDALDDAAAAGRLEALYWLAEAELRLQDLDLSVRHFGRGLELAVRYQQAQLGNRMRSGLARAQGRGPEQLPPGRAESGTAAPERSTVSALGLLSKREQGIARLVSEGMTNQQIATRLVISPKTVETYLARVFKKLEVTSRVQVAHLVGRAGGGLPVAG